MSDDVNKSNKPVNGGNIPKHLKDLFEQHDFFTSTDIYYKGKLPELRAQEEKYEKLLKNAISAEERNRYQENLDWIIAEQVEETARIDATYIPRANQALASSIETYSKHRNINSRTTTMSSQQKYAKIAMTSNKRYLPTEQIEARNQQLIEEASSVGNIMRELSSTLDPYSKENDALTVLGGYAQKMGQIEDEIAFNKRLLKVQNRQGLSTEKLINKGEDLDIEISDFLKKRSIEQRVARGDTKSYDEEIEQLGNLRENRKKLQEQYNDAIENGSDMAAIFAEKLKEANDALDDQTRLVKSMSQKAGDGSGIFGGRNVAMIQGAMFVGGAISNVSANIGTTIGTQDITQMGNRAAFAAMGNAIYGKAQAAIYKNDIDAALEIVSSDKFAQAFADKNRKIGHATGWISATGNAVVNIGGGTLKGGAIGGQVGAIIGAASGLSDTVSEMSNLAYGNVGANLSIASYNAAKNLTAEERKIRSSQMQGFYNHGLAIYNQATGLGNTNAFSANSSLMNMRYLGGLAKVGMSATEAANLLPMLRQAGAFNFENEALPAMMSAGRMRQAGIMDTGEYMSAFARMRSMGGSDSDLQKIITAGFENAKNINQMVDASVQMSTNLANLGVSGVSSTSDMLTASTQMLKNIGVDPNIAIGMAQNNMANYNKAIQDSGFNLGNIVERQQLRNSINFKNASVFQMDELANMSAQEHKIFRDAQSGNEEAMKQARMLARNKGITGLMFDASGNIKSGAVNELGESALTGALLNVGSAGENKNILRKLRSGGDLSDEQRAILKRAGFNEETALIALGIKGADRAKDGNFYLERDGQKRDQIAAYNEVIKLNEGARYSKELDPSKRAFENLENLMQTVSEVVDPAKFSEVVGKAAEEFRVPVANFGNHVDKMGKMLDNIVEQQTRMLNMMGEDRGVKYTPKLQSKPK